MNAHGRCPHSRIILAILLQCLLSAQAIAQPAASGGVPAPESGIAAKAAIGEIEARARTWNEPSQESEDRYVKAISLWLDDLPARQQEEARRILADARHNLVELRQAIRAKKAELAAINFDRDTSPQHLCRLGMELRSLQSGLRNRLVIVSQRLKEEANIEMEPINSQTLWLSPRAPL